MAQKSDVPKYDEAQADATDSSTMFHGPVKGYVSNSTGTGPTISYSHNTHIYNVSPGPGAIPAPASCCNHIKKPAPSLLRSAKGSLGRYEAKTPSISQLHMDFLTMSPEMQKYVESQENSYWEIAADSKNGRGSSPIVHDPVLKGIISSRRALNEEIQAMSTNMQYQVRNLERAYRNRKVLREDPTKDGQDHSRGDKE